MVSETVIVPLKSGIPSGLKSKFHYHN